MQRLVRKPREPPCRAVEEHPSRTRGAPLPNLPHKGCKQDRWNSDRRSCQSHRRDKPGHNADSVVLSTYFSADALVAGTTTTNTVPLEAALSHAKPSPLRGAAARGDERAGTGRARGAGAASSATFASAARRQRFRRRVGGTARRALTAWRPAPRANGSPRRCPRRRSRCEARPRPPPRARPRRRAAPRPRQLPRRLAASDRPRVRPPPPPRAALCRGPPRRRRLGEHGVKFARRVGGALRQRPQLLRDNSDAAPGVARRARPRRWRSTR